jgi:hypothetical protein
MSACPSTLIVDHALALRRPTTSGSGPSEQMRSHSFLLQKARPCLLSYSLIYLEYHPPSSSRYTTHALLTTMSDHPSIPTILGRCPLKSQQQSTVGPLPARSVSMITTRQIMLTCDGLLWEEEFYRITEDAFNSELAAKVYAFLVSTMPQEMSLLICYIPYLCSCPRPRVYPW